MFFFILFILGLVFGSFGSVLLLRLDGKLSWEILYSIICGRSKCPSCHHSLNRRQLIPLLGWMVQGGRCRSCRQKISTIYPICELVSGIIFVGRGLIVHNNLGALDSFIVSDTLLLIMRWLMGLILVWDIYTYHLHTKIWFILCVVMLFWVVVIGDLSVLGGAVIGGLTFLSLYLFARVYVRVRFANLLLHHEGIGLGDVMMAPIIGTLLASRFSVMDGGLLHYLNIDMSVIGVIQGIVIFILCTCLLGLLWYTVSYFFFSHNKSPDWSEGMGPVIPFLPSMIITYWIFFLLS